MVNYIPWEPADIILGYEVIDLDETKSTRGKKRSKNGAGATNHKANYRSYAAAAESATRDNSNNRNPSVSTNQFHPSLNGVVTPPTHACNNDQHMEAQKEEIQPLKFKMQQSIAALKKSQSNFEKETVEKQCKYEAKMDKVATPMQKELNVTNKKITQIHDAMKSHVTEEFIEKQFAENTSGLIAWLEKAVVCQPQPQSIAERTQ
jgi:hypothetical protein